MTRAFTPSNLAPARLLAAQAAVLLEATRIAQSLEAAVRERTQNVSHRHDELMRAERQTVEQHMAGGFAHEMRNALGPARYTLEALGAFDTPDPSKQSLLKDLEARVSAGLAALQQQPPQVSAAIEALQAIGAGKALAAEMFETLVLSIERGMGITDATLAYAQVGHLVVGDDSASLDKVVDAVVREYRDKIERSGIHMQIDVGSPAVAFIKEEHAFTIVRNLIANAQEALASTDAHAARVLHVTGRIEADEVTLEVRDTGAGMSADTQARIFRPFFTTKGASGTGLGLGLSRKLAETYGGTLEFASVEHQGTAFTLRLPIRRTPLKT